MRFGKGIKVARGNIARRDLTLGLLSWFGRCGIARAGASWGSGRGSRWGGLLVLVGMDEVSIEGSREEM
jgi:hypothetical protein